MKPLDDDEFEVYDEPSTFTERIVAFVKNNWKVTAAVVTVLVIVIGYIWHSDNKAAEENQARIQALIASQEAEEPQGQDYEATAGIDEILMQDQPNLVSKYGKAKKGFIWDTDGTLLSLGDKNMPADKVVYTYLRALNTLDFSTAQRLSRRSSVINTYNDYFSRDYSTSSDYKDQFMRDMYKESLLSLQVSKVQRSANFSNNKEVYTVNAKMIDLTDKSFWNKDRDRIFDSLYAFSRTEQDSTKADLFLYDYVSKAYQESVRDLTSGNPPKEGAVPMREVSFDLTVQRYPAQDSGWLVSIDRDLDMLCRYTEGTNIIQYIKSVFRDYETERREREQEERRS